LPSPWLYRDETRDYGIDGRVEIFDEKNLGTGRMFLVQLKATDQLELGKALTVKLRREQYEYYRRLDMPVLIVAITCRVRKYLSNGITHLIPITASRGRKPSP
jgi:hypothetical protein